MKKTIIVLTAVLFYFTLSGYAQLKSGSITGSIIDANAKIIEAANVSLLLAKDSSLIKMSAADKKGKFSFENIGVGKYLVSFSAVGFQTGYSNIVEITPKNLSVVIKTIVLVTQARSLSAVTVTSKRPLYVQSLF